MYVCVCVCACACACIHARVPAYMHVWCMYLCMLHACTRACIHVCMIVTASIHTQQTFQLHFIRRELVVGKTWVTKLQNASCNDTKQTTLKMQVAREIKLHIVHTYVVVRSLPF